MTFEFRVRLSVLYFLFSATPTGFLISVCPLTKPPRNLLQKYSPTDSEKQTAVVCKDNGLFFFDKAFALSKTIHVSQDPARAAVARYARNGACLVCVCVCVCTYPNRIISSRIQKQSRYSRYQIYENTIHT